ncbi:vWA domain-containing protein (plasmid) [Mycolicibacterium aichiense]|uniref:vWA domain-containing protein n=1 Tax=Mycolicibacterium aichiense TaxID=1799 RepID=UPI003D676441
MILALALVMASIPAGGLISLAQADAPNGNGSEYVATCMQSAHTLSALFLYDKSQSLQTSDSSGARYDGLKVALKSLAGIKRADGAPVAIEAAVSAFDNAYYNASSVVDWTTLNDGTDDDARAKIIDDIVNKAKNSTAPEGGTHFTDALQGAWSDIKDRGSQGTCRVVFFFTDGEDEQNTVGAPLASRTPDLWIRCARPESSSSACN